MNLSKHRHSHHLGPNRLKRIFQTLDAFPTTRFRLFCTTLLIVGTGITYLLHACFMDPRGWTPSSSWLTFLCAASGIDATQYGLRGFIEARPAAVTPPDASKPLPTDTSEDSTASTDLSEAHTPEQKG